MRVLITDVITRVPLVDAETDGSLAQAMKHALEAQRLGGDHPLQVQLFDDNGKLIDDNIAIPPPGRR